MIEDAAQGLGATYRGRAAGHAGRRRLLQLPRDQERHLRRGWRPGRARPGRWRPRGRDHPREGHEPQRVPPRRGGQVHLGGRGQQLRAVRRAGGACSTPSSTSSTRSTGGGGAVAARYRAELADWARARGVRLPPARPDRETNDHLFFLLLPDEAARDRCLAPPARAPACRRRSTTCRSTRRPSGAPGPGADAALPVTDRVAAHAAAPAPPSRCSATTRSTRVVAAVRVLPGLKRVTEPRRQRRPRLLQRGGDAGGELREIWKTLASTAPPLRDHLRRRREPRPHAARSSARSWRDHPDRVRAIFHETQPGPRRHRHRRLPRGARRDRRLPRRGPRGRTRATSPRWCAAIEEGADVATVRRIYAFQLGSLDRYFMSRGYSLLVRRLLDVPPAATPRPASSSSGASRCCRCSTRSHDPGWFWDTEFMVRAAPARAPHREIPGAYVRRDDKTSTRPRRCATRWTYFRKLLAFRRELRGPRDEGARRDRLAQGLPLRLVHAGARALPPAARSRSCARPGCGCSAPASGARIDPARRALLQPLPQRAAAGSTIGDRVLPGRRVPARPGRRDHARGPGDAGGARAGPHPHERRLSPTIRCRRTSPPCTAPVVFERGCFVGAASPILPGVASAASPSWRRAASSRADVPPRTVVAGVPGAAVAHARPVTDARPARGRPPRLGDRRRRRRPRLVPSLRAGSPVRTGASSSATSRASSSRCASSRSRACVAASSGSGTPSTTRACHCPACPPATRSSCCRRSGRRRPASRSSWPCTCPWRPSRSSCWPVACGLRAGGRGGRRRRLRAGRLLRSSTLNLYVYVHALAWAPLVVWACCARPRAAGGGSRSRPSSAGSRSARRASRSSVRRPAGGRPRLARPRRSSAVAGRRGRAPRPRPGGAVLAALGSSTIGTARAAGFSPDVVLDQSVHPFTFLQVLVAELYGKLGNVVERVVGRQLLRERVPVRAEPLPRRRRAGAGSGRAREPAAGSRHARDRGRVRRRGLPGPVRRVGAAARLRCPRRGASSASPPRRSSRCETVVALLVAFGLEALAGGERPSGAAPGRGAALGLGRC